jgi:hypothetical protein
MTIEKSDVEMSETNGVETMIMTKIGSVESTTANHRVTMNGVKERRNWHHLELINCIS